MIVTGKILIVGHPSGNKKFFLPKRSVCYTFYGINKHFSRGFYVNFFEFISKIKGRTKHTVSGAVPARPI